MLQLIILSSRKYVQHVNSTSPLSHLCRSRACLTQHTTRVNGAHFVSHFASSISKHSVRRWPSLLQCQHRNGPRPRWTVEDHYYFPVVVCCYLENVGPPQRCVFGPLWLARLASGPCMTLKGRDIHRLYITLFSLLVLAPC